MADVSTFTSWSSTAGNNNPTGGTVIGAGLDDNLREIQAQVAAWRDGTGYGILTVTGASGTNTITGSTSPAPTLAANQKFLLSPAATNTAATTLNLNGGGAKNIYAGNSALVGGELHANIPVVIEYDGTQFQMLGPIFRQQTRQVLTSGSGATYTTPTGATRINVRMVGGGGGGAAQQSNVGSDGADSTFGTLTAAKGSGGTVGAAGGAGGAGTNGDINITGQSGQGGTNNSSVSFGAAGGQGGATPFGGGGAGGGNNTAGVAASTNSGGGGGGAGGVSTPFSSGGGGGAGAYVEKLIVGPSSTYTYTVGSGGAGGTAGGKAGGNGAAGIIVVDEFYS